MRLLLSEEFVQRGGLGAVDKHLVLVVEVAGAFKPSAQDEYRPNMGLDQ